MRNYENLGGGATYFAFRDPNGVPWEIRWRARSRK